MLLLNTELASTITACACELPFFEFVQLERSRRIGLYERTKPEITKNTPTDARPANNRRRTGSWRMQVCVGEERYPYLRDSNQWIVKWSMRTMRAARPRSPSR